MADITVNNKYTSGTFSTTNNYVKFAVEITELSYNIENNTSQVKVRVYAWRSNSGYTTYGAGTCYVTIAGTQYSQSISSSQTITYNSNTEIFNKTLTVAHDDDGTLNLTTLTSWSINAQGSGSYNYTGTTSAVSFNRALTTIPRASDITCTSPVDMGTSQSVTITQKSASFSHILYYSTDGGTTWTEVGRNTATHTYSWSVPDTSNSLPNADTAAYTLKCETYLNGTYSDTPLESTAAIVANVPAAYVPTITIGSITEGNAAVPAGFPFIVGHSKPTIPTTFTGSHNSTVASRAITLNGETLTSTATVEPVSLTATRALSATTTAVTATATDSRGRQGTDTTNITAQAYNSPSVEIDCTRCLSDGTIDPLGTYVLVLAKWSWTSVTNGGGELNSANIVLKKNGTTVSTYSTATNTQNTLTQIAILSGFNNTDQYTITAEITDLLVSSTVSQLITKAQMPLSLYDDGNDIGVTVGRMATQGGLNNWLDLGLVSGNNVKLYDPADSSQIATNSTDSLLFEDTGNGIVRADGDAVAMKTVGGQSLFGSGDIPVAGSDIYDTGSNTNGYWIRYNNGVMICWNRVTVTNQSLSNAYGNHYQGTRQMTFPIEFAEVPTATCSEFLWGTSASWGSVSTVTKTAVTCRGIDLYNRASGTACRIAYIAIGYWK